MTLARRLLGLSVAAALIAAGAWLWRSPYWQMQAFDQEIRRGDLEGINSRIDYPALQADVARQMRERAGQVAMRGGITHERMADVAGKADAFAAAMINPTTIGEMFGVGAGRDPGDQSGAGALDLAIDRTGLRTFQARAVNGPPFFMMFELQGATWRAVGLDLSAGFAEQDRSRK